MMRRVPRSRLAAGLAILLAVAAHAAALVNTDDVEEAQIEGGGGDGEVAALGSSFQDLTAGLSEPVTAEEILPDTPAEQQTPEEREVAEPEEVQETPQSRPVEAKPVEPVEKTAETTPKTPKPVVQPAEAMHPARQEPVQQTPTRTVAPKAGVEVLPPQPVTPKTTETTPMPTAQPVTPVTPETEPQKAAEPVDPEPAEVTPEEPVTTAAQAPLPDDPVEPEPEDNAPTASLKPMVRPDDLRPPEPVKTPPKPKVAVASQGSNVDHDERKGSATGSSDATAARAAQTNAGSTEAGNAALSNYRGKVFGRIARAKRGSVNIKGAAIVSLTIGPSGQLAGLRIARSSGSGKLDDIALAQVRRAAPFPAPPGGGSLTFTVKISGVH